MLDLKVILTISRSKFGVPRVPLTVPHGRGVAFPLSQSRSLCWFCKGK